MARRQKTTFTLHVNVEFSRQHVSEMQMSCSQSIVGLHSKPLPKLPQPHIHLTNRRLQSAEALVGTRCLLLLNMACETCRTQSPSNQAAGTIRKKLLFSHQGVPRLQCPETRILPTRDDLFMQKEKASKSKKCQHCIGGKGAARFPHKM